MNHNINDFINLSHHMLVPPGNGVHTVHTASNIIKNVQEKLYQKSFPESDILTQWKLSFENLEQESNPLLIGICSDTGGGIQRGANWGPLYLRKSLLEITRPNLFFDLGDVKVIPHLLHDKYLTELHCQ